MSHKYTQQIDEEQVDTTCSRDHPVPMKRTVNDIETYWWWHIGLAAGGVALLLASSGCHAGGVDPASFEFVDNVQWGPEPTECHDTFNPAPELLDETEWALDIWEQATGKTLCIGDEGIPVHYAPEVWVDGKSVCGNTMSGYGQHTGKYYYTAYIEISQENLGCISDQLTTLHEIGHAISHRNMDQPVHTDSYSVLSAQANSSTDINEAALELVCSNSDCPARPQYRNQE